MVYWIVEGGLSLRFHAGDCYMPTPSRAFQQHREVPPDHSRVQSFPLHLEGIFRLLPAPCVRRETELLQEVEQMWQDTDRDEAAFLDRFPGSLLECCVERCRALSERWFP